MEGRSQVSSWRDEAGGSEASIRRPDVLGLVLQGAGFARTGAEPLHALSAAKYFARSLLHWKMIRSCLTDPANAALRETLALRPSLLRCVARPYLTQRWGTARKLEAILGHYRLLRGRLAFLRFDPSCPLPLGSAADCVQISLEKAGWFEHEGELTLSLFRDGTRVYSLVFTLGDVESRTVAYVGALQGLGRGDALGIYRALTRRLHGLRPRDLLIAAFRSLCIAIGVERILAVSDAACVGRSRYFGARTRVLASYDRAWAENGGLPGADGFFELSPCPTRRSMGEIASRKRAEHRRRYAMLDELAIQIHCAVEWACMAPDTRDVLPSARGRRSVTSASAPAVLRAVVDS